MKSIYNTLATAALFLILSLIFVQSVNGNHILPSAIATFFLSFLSSTLVLWLLSLFVFSISPLAAHGGRRRRLPLGVPWKSWIIFVESENGRSNIMKTPSHSCNYPWVMCFLPRARLNHQLKKYTEAAGLYILLPIGARAQCEIGVEM